MNSRITGTIDFHAHLLTDEYRKAVARLGIDPIEEEGFPLPAWTAEDHLAFMDAADIELAVLTAPPPHLHNGNDALAREAARLVNESAAGICAEHPDRFAFAASLPLPCVDGAMEEARYAMDTLGAVGVRLATNSNGIYLGDPTLEPLMEELNHRRALAIIHPCRARLRPGNVITGTVAAIYEYPADTTRAVLNMMANRVMTRYPDIRFVIPHVGSFLPYML